MPLSVRALSERVAIVHVGKLKENEYGNEEVGEVARDDSVPAYLEQVSEREVTDDRDTQIADWLVVLPAGTQISGRDKVVWGDETFEVVGPPSRFKTPRGEHHIEARLRHIEG